MLLPLADHLAFAVARVRDGNALSNPLTEDIRALFPRNSRLPSAVSTTWASVWA